MLTETQESKRSKCLKKKLFFTTTVQHQIKTVYLGTIIILPDTLSIKFTTSVTAEIICLKKLLQDDDGVDDY